MSKYPKYELSSAQIEKIDLQRFRDSFAAFIHSHEEGREYTKSDFSNHLLNDGFKVEELSKTNKVITYDLRGFGKSSLPNGKYSHIEDLHELLKELNIQNTKIVGHSFGGEVAVEYALKYPQSRHLMDI